MSIAFFYAISTGIGGAVGPVLFGSLLGTGEPGKLAVEAIRAGQVQLTDGYVVIRDGELYLIGCRINALRSASTHVQPEADRTKKLLMRKDEIRRLIGKVEQNGFTLVPLTCTTRAAGSRPRSRSPRARPSTTSATPRRSATGSARRAG